MTEWKEVTISEIAFLKNGKKRGCVKIGTSSFLRKAPTFSSQGFVMS